MTYIHIGERPIGRLTAKAGGLERVYKGCFFEAVGAGYKVWSTRRLTSGCGGHTDGDKILDGLIYCPHCEEYFREEEYEKFDDRD